MLDQVVAAGLRPAQQCRQDIETVRRISGTELLTGQRRQGGRQVDLAGEGCGDTRFDSSRPADEKRHPRPGVEGTVFAAAQRSGGLMPIEQLDRLIFISIIDHRPVVTRKNHERVLRQTEAIQRPENFPNGPVELQNGIAARAQAAAAGKARVRHARDVDVMSGEIQKERLVLVLSR